MKYLRPVIIWCVVLVAGYLIVTKWLIPLFAPEEEETDVSTSVVMRGDLREVVPADGQVTPEVLVEVKSKASGLVEEIHIEPGDEVERDAVLIELDKEEIRQRLRQAEAQLLRAKAQLKKTKNDITPEQQANYENSVEQARVSHDNAQASYDRIKDLYDHDPPFATQDELDRAKTSLDQAELTLERAEEQLAFALDGGEPDDIAIAEADVEDRQAQVDNVLEELANTTIRAPLDGTVLTRPVEIGSAVASGTSGNAVGTVVATIADLSTLYVQAQIEETNLGRVNVGGPCRITFDAYPGWLWTGKVTKIYPQGEQGQGGTQFPVDITIDLASAAMEGAGMGGGGGRMMASGGGRPGGPGGPRGGPGGGAAPAGETPEAVEPGEAGAGEAGGPPAPKLLPSMTANVEIVLEDHPQVLILPAQYVQYDEGKPYCEVLPNPEDQETRERRDIELGYTDGLRYEVISGIEEGETIVLERSISSNSRFF